MGNWRSFYCLPRGILHFVLIELTFSKHIFHHDVSSRIFQMVPTSFYQYQGFWQISAFPQLNSNPNQRLAVSWHLLQKFPFLNSSIRYQQSSTQFYNNMFTILAVHCLNHSATSSIFTILKCVCPPCPAAMSYSWQNFLLSPPGAHLSYWTNTRQSLCPEGWYHRQAKCSKTPKVLVFHGVSSFHRPLLTQS